MRRQADVAEAQPVSAASGTFPAGGGLLTDGGDDQTNGDQTNAARTNKEAGQP